MGNQNEQPPKDESQYSGAHPDDRDPKLVGEGFPDLEAELRERQENTVVLTARRRLLDLQKAKARGANISEADIRLAEQAVLDAEATARDATSEET